MDNKRKKIFVSILIIVSALIIVGLFFMFGFFTQPEVHLFSQEFEYQGELAVLSLRFESSNGVFTAGQEINVNAFLTYTFSTRDNDIHLLYFPNSFTPEEYKKLLVKENFGKMILDEDGTGFSFEAAPTKILMNLGNFPPEAEFDAVWTQDGPKDAILIMNAESIGITEEQLHKDGIVIEKTITIQPSYVKLQMQSNNVSIGLALIITAITILAGLFGVEKISTVKNDSQRKK